MKKITALLAFAALAWSISAQTLNVQGAIESLRKGYLSKAKDQIDAASADANTGTDAKTWCYKGLIYTQIGLELQNNPKSKYSKMYAELDPAWFVTAYEAAQKCQELDSKGEFAEQIKGVYRLVAEAYYMAGATKHDAQDYAEGVKLADVCIKICNITGETAYKNAAYFLGGSCARALHDNDMILKYYQPLTRSAMKDENMRKNIPNVFNTLFGIYVGKKDTVELMKLVNRYTKNYPDDYNAYMLQARAEAWRGNSAKAKEMIGHAVAKVGDDPSIKSSFLCQAASILEVSGDTKGAEEQYQASLKINPQQFTANYNMGIMIFNQGADKKNEAEKKDDNNDAEYEQYLALTKEANAFFDQSIQYFKNALSYLESLTNEDEIAMNRKNLYDCLKSLSHVYTILERYDDLKPIKEKLKPFESQQ